MRQRHDRLARPHPVHAHLDWLGDSLTSREGKPDMVTGMENPIEQAARVMARAYFGEPVEQDDMECATEWARALADAGLLAPTPLREEWAVERPDPVDDQPRYDKFPTLEAALAERWSGDRAVRRLVTNWEGVDGDRDEWKARAEAAERERGTARDDERLDHWARITRHPFFRGCFADDEMAIDSMTAALDRAEAAEARTAPAVTRDEIESAIESGGDHTPDTCDCTEQEICEGLADAAAAVWALVSGADPAVHVVRESHIAAVKVERSTRSEWEINGRRMGYGDPDPDYVRDRCHAALEAAARNEAWARAIEAEADVDPVEAKAAELWGVAHHDGPFEWDEVLGTVREKWLRLAAHVLGQEADQ